MPLLFVYGSLRKGLYASRILKSSAFVGMGVVENYALYNLGRYPGAKPKVGYRIKGEVYSITDELFQVLDRFEDCPVLYKRELVDVKMDSGDVLKAWMYVYNLPVSERKIIRGGDWVEFVKSG